MASDKQETDSWRCTAHRYILNTMRSFTRFWALQVLNTNSLRALLNTGGLKICFKANTCLHSLLNQNQNPVCWHSLGFTDSRIMPRRTKWVCNFQQKQPSLQSYQGPQTGRRETRPRFLSVLESWQSAKEAAEKNLSFPPFFPRLAERVGACSSIQIGLSHFQKWIRQGNSCLSWGCK